MDGCEYCAQKQEIIDTAAGIARSVSLDDFSLSFDEDSSSD